MGDIRELNPIYRIESRDHSAIPVRKRSDHDEKPSRDPDEPGDQVELESVLEEEEYYLIVDIPPVESDDQPHLDISA